MRVSVAFKQLRSSVLVLFFLLLSLQAVSAALPICSTHLSAGLAAESLDSVQQHKQMAYAPSLVLEHVDVHSHEAGGCSVCALHCHLYGIPSASAKGNTIFSGLTLLTMQYQSFSGHVADTPIRPPDPSFSIVG